MTVVSTEPLPRVSGAEFLAQFDPSIHAAIRRKAAEPGTDGLFMAECHDFWSSHLGERAAVVFGPDRTFTAAKLVRGGLLGGMSYERKSMVNYATSADILAAFTESPVEDQR